eukprot:781648-Prymnesium_polylepis.1
MVTSQPMPSCSSHGTRDSARGARDTVGPAWAPAWLQAPWRAPQVKRPPGSAAVALMEGARGIRNAAQGRSC